MNGQGVFIPERMGLYVGKVTQATTAAPALPTTPLVNTLASTPVIARTSAGVYTLTKTGLFTVGKTVVRCTGNGAGGADIRAFNVVYTSADVVTIYVFDFGATPAAADSGNFDLEIQIWY